MDCNHVQGGNYLMLLRSILIVLVAATCVFSQATSALARYSSNDKAEALFNEGLAFTRKGKYRLAIGKYRQAVKLDHTFVASYINMSLCYNKVSDPRSAITAATSALKYNPTSSYAFVNRARAYKAMLKYNNAIYDYNNAIKYEPNQPSYYLERGTCLERIGMKKEANADFQKAMKLPGKTAWENFEKGEAYYGLGEFKKAISMFSLAIKQDPNLLVAVHDRGLCYATINNYASAIADYSLCLKKDPTYYHCYYLRGSARLMSGKSALAAQDFKKHLELMRWRGSHAPYAVMMGVLAYRLSKNNKAATDLLNQAGTKLSLRGSWPAPVIEFLAGRLSQKQLLASAGRSTDRLTEAKTYLGINLVASGKIAQGKKELTWVRQNGNRKFSEYQLATAELSRNSASP